VWTVVERRGKGGVRGEEEERKRRGRGEEEEK
jgi:hypothetical protein